MKLSAALRTNPFAFRQIMLHHFNRQVFRQFVRCQTCPLAVVFLNLDELRFRYVFIGKQLSLIENGKLGWIIFAFLAGCFEMRSCSS